MGRGETMIRDKALSKTRGSPITRSMRSLPAFGLLAGLAGLAACVPAPRPAPPPAAPVPVPSPAPSAAPPVASAFSDWRDVPLSPGGWTYRRDASGSVALFGTSADLPEFQLRCDRAEQRVVVVRRGVSAGPLLIRTSSSTRSLTARPAGASMEVRLRSDDPVLDAMGYSRGRFVVDTPPLAPLVVPSWAEVQRVAEDCRG